MTSATAARPDPAGADRDGPPPDATAAYGEDPAQVYDVRLPRDGAGGGASIVVVHGGFWRAAHDRSHAAAQAQAFADAGYPTAVVEYRRVGMSGGGYPGTLEDVQAAIAAVAGDPRLPGPLVAVGHSAGGHLAVWAASQPATPLSAVVSLAGCVDLALSATRRLGSGATEDLLGGLPAEVPERYAAADPAAVVPAPVPVALVHGERDTVVPLEISTSYAAASAAHGRPVVLRVLAEAGHDELIDPAHPAFEVVLELVAELTPR